MGVIAIGLIIKVKGYGRGRKGITYSNAFILNFLDKNAKLKYLDGLVLKRKCKRKLYL